MKAAINADNDLLKSAKGISVITFRSRHQAKLYLKKTWFKYEKRPLMLEERSLKSAD